MYAYLAGTQEEITQTIQALHLNGFTFTQGKILEFYSLSHKTPYGCLLQNFCNPPTRQLRPWDAALGGEN